MNARFSRCLVCVPIALLLAPSLHAADGYKHAAKIDELVQPVIDGGEIPSMVIGVVDQGTHWFGNYGRLSATEDSKPSATTLYEIGSITKVFTGILLADAVHAGKLKLDDPIGSVWPEVAKANPGVGESVLLRHLATHTSGLPRMPSNWKPADPKKPYVDYDRKLMLEFLSTVKLSGTPGRPSGYSNIGAATLAELLAERDGVSYGELLSKKITGPLLMSDTVLTLEAAQRPRLAPPYQLDGSASEEWEFDAMAGAGAIRSTSRDMLRFIDAHLKPRKDDLGKAIDLAWTKHTESEAGSFEMGLGWHIARDGSTRWHNGQTGGYHSILYINRELRAGVVVLANSASPVVDQVGEMVMRLIAGNEVKPIEGPGEAVDAEVLERLSGRYELVPGFVLTVEPRGGRLYVQATGQPQLKLAATSDTEWQIEGVDAKLVFELPEDGKASAVVLHQNGATPRAKRIDP